MRGTRTSSELFQGILDIRHRLLRFCIRRCDLPGRSEISYAASPQILDPFHRLLRDVGCIAFGWA